MLCKPGFAAALAAALFAPAMAQQGGIAKPNLVLEQVARDCPAMTGRPCG